MQKAPVVKCTDPYVSDDGMVFRCGRCICCRIDRANVWSHRLLLESSSHPVSSFWTLTYSPEFLPADGSLSVRALQLFLKRLRLAIEPQRIRYYACGEYGDRGRRPHYHLIIYNFLSCQLSARALMGRECDCRQCVIVRSAWSQGFVNSRPFDAKAANYVSGYITKERGWRKEGSPELGARRPEFSVMSRKPAIGSSFVPAIAETLLKYPVWKERGYDVPGTLKYGPGHRPIGRTLHRKLRLAVGEPEGAPQKYLEALREGFQPYFDVVEESFDLVEAKRLSRYSSPARIEKEKRVAVGKAIGAGNRQLSANMLAKFRFKGRTQTRPPKLGRTL